MADINFPAGSTIDLTITLSETVASFDNIFVTLYGAGKASSGKKVYSLLEIEGSGFGEISAGSTDYEIIVKALAKHTARMLGRLMYEIKLVTEQDSTTLEEIGESIPVATSIILVNNESKNLRS